MTAGADPEIVPAAESAAALELALGVDSAKKGAADLEQILPAVAVDDVSDDEETKRKRCKSEALNILKLFGTNVALICLVAAYCAVGGLIFNNLEEPFEISECQRTRSTYKASLSDAVNEIDFLSSNLQLSDGERSQMYSQTMEKLRVSFQKSGWDMRDCENMVPAWNWMGAFFFCLTVVSTIGYGQIAPRTSWGRIIVMFYAIVGLPVMFATLASVGNVMAHMFKWFYNVFCCCGCCVRHRKARVRIKPPAIMWRVNAQGKPIGDGPSVLAEDSDSELEDEAEVNIPLTVSLLVIAMSLLMGAVIFSTYENWGFLDAAYYSFVSLATIGFGDLVPDFSNANSLYCQGKMIVTWLFLVTGMALVSMCLQMMQTEVAQKVKWLTEKFKKDKAAKENLKAQREAEQKDKEREEAEELVQLAAEEAAREEAEREPVKVSDVRPTTPGGSERPRTGAMSANTRSRLAGVPMSARPVTSRNTVAPVDRVASGYRH